MKALRAAIIVAITCLLVFVLKIGFFPVPWPDASAFFLPGLDLLARTHHWRMHTQAAFVPSYDIANYNTMPALPLILGFAAKFGIVRAGRAAFALRTISAIPLMVWAFLLWDWIGLVAIAGLLDPIVDWGTLVVRTEMWIGLAWLLLLREGSREKPRPWAFAAILAGAAYFHFEAVVLIPAAAVLLLRGTTAQTKKRMSEVASRAAVLLSPWFLYALVHFSLFREQMAVQFHRLAPPGNPWLDSAHSVFNSLFLAEGSPSDWPKFFNLGKGVGWALILFAIGATIARARKSREALACLVFFFTCVYLWVTKPEIWFTTLIHLALWVWIAVLATQLQGRLKKALLGLTGTYLAIAVISALVTEFKLPRFYSWPVYDRWVTCIENTIPPGALKIWQPHVPDALVELAMRRPELDLTRALDFDGAKPRALHLLEDGADVIAFTRYFNLTRKGPPPNYEGPVRPEDKTKLLSNPPIPFARESLAKLASEPGRWERNVCETGPFWAELWTRRR